MKTTLLCVLIVLATTGLTESVAAARSQPDVRVTSKAIDIEFGHARILFAREPNRGILGIQSVWVQDECVLSAERDEIRPTEIEYVVKGEVRPIGDWDAYLRDLIENDLEWPSQGEKHIARLNTSLASYEGYVVRDHQEVVLSFMLPEQRGTFKWHVKPAEIEIKNRVFSGLSWAVSLDGFQEATHLHVHEPVRLHNRDWFLHQVMGNWIEYQVDFVDELEVPGGDYEITEGVYFVDYLPFFFKSGLTGTLVSFFDQPVATKVKLIEEDRRLFQHLRIPLGDGTTRCTPFKQWALNRVPHDSKWSAINQWTAVYDTLAPMYRSQAHLPENKLWTSWSMEYPPLDYTDKHTDGNAPPLEKSWFVTFADTQLHKAAQAGFKTVMVVIWESDADYTKTRYPFGIEPAKGEQGNNNSVRQLKVSPMLGGVRGFKYLVDRAHELELKIVVWLPACLSVSSPIVRAHPDWVSWKADGRPQDGGFTGVVGMSFFTDYFDYMVQALRELKQQTNFDGIGLDTFQRFAGYADYQQAQPTSHLAKFVELQQHLYDMGVSYIDIEGNGFFGLSTGGYPGGQEAKDRQLPWHTRRWINHRIDLIDGKEYGLYRYVGDGMENVHRYFRALASKGIGGNPQSNTDLEALPQGEQRQFVRINHDYLKIMDRMVHRKILGQDERWLGVVWKDQTGTKETLFSFTHFDYPIQANRTVRDITSDQILTNSSRVRSPSRQSKLSTKPWRIYTID